MLRPIPPTLSPAGAFAPDQHGLGEWVSGTFLDADGLLPNPDHAHLVDASIGWLWTNYDAAAQGRMIAGEARIPRTGGARWSQAAGCYQLEQWFGHIPDFVITISAPIAEQMTDGEFCALVEHELYHCAQALDPFGMPRFDREGKPIFTMRGHDVEQFVGVVARYGHAAAGVTELVRAANRPPLFDEAETAFACGSCLRKAA